MPIDDYISTHALSGGFIASQLRSLADLISEQGELLLQDAGLEFPARAVSSVLLIGERGEISTADIAKVLKQPHQLVTQRIDILITSGIVERFADAQDGRRKILRLTPRGKVQFELLQERLAKVSRVFADMFEHLQCDLPEITNRVTTELDNRSVLDRVRLL